MAQPFIHRGLMLDVSRHFMPVPEIKRLLTAAAYCGVNRFHWHLTDDQGWRLEILKYPKLTEIGAFRGDTHFGGVSVSENNCGFYTQQEVRELVAFASSLAAFSTVMCLTMSASLMSGRPCCTPLSNSAGLRGLA